MSVEPTPDRIRELIAKEGEALDRVCAFIRSGMRAGTISAENGQLLIDTAETVHDGTVRVLRALLGEDQE
jgi:hypothetical protein